MSASEKQIAANRRNAGKSTGPKTRRGKKASSRNAITHGLYARDTIAPSFIQKIDWILDACCGRSCFANGGV